MTVYDLVLRFPDGVIASSHHISADFLVRYLKWLGLHHEDVTVLTVSEHDQEET